MASNYSNRLNRKRATGGIRAILPTVPVGPVRTPGDAHGLAQPRAAMESLTIAVMGFDRVGKSSFIQGALRLPRLPSLNMTSVRHDVDTTPYVLMLVEFRLDVFDTGLEQPIQWPKQIGGHVVPRVDGVFVLYDVSNKESVRDLPPTMRALANSSLPVILMATKCDVPESLRQLDTTAVSAAFPQCISNQKISAKAPASARECLHTMLKAAIHARNGESDPTAAATATTTATAASARSDGFYSSRRRAASTAANLETPAGRPVSRQNSTHSRASSDLSALRTIPGDYRNAPSPMSPLHDYKNQASYSTPRQRPAVLDDDETQPALSNTLRTPQKWLEAKDSFLDTEDSDVDSLRHSDDIPILQRNDEGLPERPIKRAGMSLDELVDRLIAPRLTRADHNFSDIFLCLYRKFASPGQLFTAILTRLERVKTDREMHFLTRANAQLQIVALVTKWVCSYPGDFARPVTRRKLEDLIHDLSTDPTFLFSAHKMRAQLDFRVVEDDDTWWEKSDEVAEVGPEAGEPGMFDHLSAPNQNAAGGRRPSTITDMTASTASISAENDSTLASAQRQISRGSSEPKAADSQHHLPPLQPPQPVSANGRTLARYQFHSIEDYEREAATMVPTTRFPLNKIRYHMFMDIDADDIADEMTRIDWVMFSSIRIRDMVRHVSLAPAQKEQCRSLENVSRMVAHFNHVARWVANMVLIRDKAKHRAPCLQKFMVIALRLRALNNYNGLAAVLAGINGASVFRLAQTRALISPEVMKKFARLGILMGTAKSHFAYRLAWENSPLPRIPFVPLHRRDLVSAEEGSYTFIGTSADRINWKKFEVLADVLLPLMKSQGQPYPNLHRHELARELIMDCRVATDEDDIYQRSLQVEGVATGGDLRSQTRRRFAWLAKAGG